MICFLDITYFSEAVTAKSTPKRNTFTQSKCFFFLIKRTFESHQLYNSSNQPDTLRDEISCRNLCEFAWIFFAFNKLLCVFQTIVRNTKRGYFQKTTRLRYYIGEGSFVLNGSVPNLSARWGTHNGDQREHLCRGLAIFFANKFV